MRNDERYRPKPQSNQLEIFGLGMAGEQDVAEAKKWIEANPDAWRFMLSNARRLKEKGYVSINYLVNMVRNELHVGCKNGIAPALARSWRRDTRSCAEPSTSTAARAMGFPNELAAHPCGHGAHHHAPRPACRKTAPYD